MNMLGIGMNMAKIKFPQVRLQGNLLDKNLDLAGQQVNPSCVMKYLGISGLGAQDGSGDATNLFRDFNAIPWLGLWDTYKNYFANKQEKKGAVIHKDLSQAGQYLESGQIIIGVEHNDLPIYPPATSCGTNDISIS